MSRSLVPPAAGKENSYVRCVTAVVIGATIKVGQKSGEKAGEKEEDCSRCNTSGKTRMYCSECKGKKKFLILDFKKLCNNQSLCSKCNEYSPNDSIVYSSTCKHIYCYQCYSQQRSQKCIINGCDEKLCYQLHQNNESVACSACRYIFSGISCISYWSKCNHPLCPQCFETYCSRKLRRNRIPICGIKGCNEELTVNDVIDRYSSNHWMARALNTLYYRRNRFCCTKCKQWHLDQNLFLWSICGHKYGKECAKQYIDSKLSKHEILNVFKKNQKCNHPNCEQLLQEKEAMIIGVAKYKKQKKKRNKTNSCTSFLSLI